MKKRNLALVELTLVILFMALSAAVLVQVFAAARSTSDESRAQTVGQAMAQDILERWKAGEETGVLFSEAEGWQALLPEDWGDFPLSLSSDSAADLLPEGNTGNAAAAQAGAADTAEGAVVPAGVYLLWLNKDLVPAAVGETAYCLEVSLGEEAQPAGVLHHIAVRMIADHTGQELVSFVTARYEHRPE